MANRPEFAKKMVGWYDPWQLAQTGVEVAVSTIFGRHSDQRLVEAMAAGENGGDYFDYTYYYADNVQAMARADETRRRDSIWIDYVGDVGDGWNSTYSVAYNIALPSQSFGTTETKRGDVLIFGGDEVYPTATREAYRDRLLKPYEVALGHTDENHPHVFAIPGNHDWYDSLVAFTRLFTSQRWFAGWRTRQSRSYFALKLPHNWWLLGTDVQLSSDIDRPQVEYFERLAMHMDNETQRTGKPASVILCHAEPHWIRAAQYGGIDPNYTESNLKLLEKRLHQNVAVFIAGDLHHYRRHEAVDQSTQKITAGGGGAFLHPTHTGRFAKNKLETIVERDLSGDEGRVFKLKGCFPSTKDSRGACWKNLAFPLFVFMGNKSWTLGFVTALLYWLIGLSILAGIDDPKLSNITWEPVSIAAAILYNLVSSKATLFLVLLTIVGFIFFTDTHRWLHRVPMGLAHALGHVIAAFVIAVLCISLPWPATLKFTVALRGFEFNPDFRLVLASLIIMLGGFVVGTFIMGLYLLVSLNLFNRHGNEAFSSLGIEDWKNFLRMHIDPDGNLTIYPVGIRRVPRKWKPNPSTEGPQWIPHEADTRATRPHLIEEPIFMRKAATDTGVRAEPAPQPEI